MLEHKMIDVAIQKALKGESCVLFFSDYSLAYTAFKTECNQVEKKEQSGVYWKFPSGGSILFRSIDTSIDSLRGLNVNINESEEMASKELRDFVRYNNLREC